ncbi:hypothetical protein, partial [Arthrobacter terricola]|uniref:hypothetical protein n=1 Tax=Arthrobacter terricola TaxID=2547396 RepID=UPI0014046676
DWVYRGSSVGLAAPLGIADSLGTYDFAVRTLSSGPVNAQGLWLYDSANREVNISRTSAAAGGILDGASRPHVAGDQIVMVEGQLYMEPSTWAVGNVLALGVRIGEFEQDLLTGLPSVDADYSMWNPAVVAQTEAAFANDHRNNRWERRYWMGFDTNDALQVVTIRARINMRLRGTAGLALWLEAASTSVNLRYQTWFRTLVRPA